MWKRIGITLLHRLAPTQSVTERLRRTRKPVVNYLREHYNRGGLFLLDMLTFRTFLWMYPFLYNHSSLGAAHIRLRRNYMIIFLLALIGTLIVMVILTIGRLGFGRR